MTKMSEFIKMYIFPFGITGSAFQLFDEEIQMQEEVRHTSTL